MDLKLYYQKIRDTESKIADMFPVIVSRQTDDGGSAGSCAEVTRTIAAKMITEATARLATEEEAKAYREDQAQAKRMVDQVAEAAKVHVTVVPTAELARLVSGKREKA